MNMQEIRDTYNHSVTLYNSWSSHYVDVASWLIKTLSVTLYWENSKISEWYSQDEKVNKFDKNLLKFLCDDLFIKLNQKDKLLKSLITLNTWLNISIFKEITFNFINLSGNCLFLNELTWELIWISFSYTDDFMIKDFKLTKLDYS